MNHCIYKEAITIRGIGMARTKTNTGIGIIIIQFLKKVCKNHFFKEGGVIKQ